MQYFFEYQDTLNSPYEVFPYDTTTDVFPVRAHWHYFAEMILVTEGTALMECDGKSYILQKGDLMFFPPEKVHAIYTANGYPLKYEVIKFDPNKLYTESGYVPKLKVLLESASNSENVSLCLKEERIREICVLGIIKECRRELLSKNYGYDVAVHNLLINLVLKLIRIWREDGFRTDEACSYSPDKDSLHGITAYIDEHIDEPILVEDLAELCNMSYSYFAKNFKQYYGRSCKEYIEFIRISKVEDMLLFTDFDLSYISQETGFSDSSHLIKIFRKWKGMTPKQFKKSAGRDSL